MNKTEYIRAEIEKLTLSFTASLLKIAAVVILSLGLLDYFATPEQFKEFFLYRLIAVGLYGLMFVSFNRAKKYPAVYIVLAAIVVSGMIELMIFSLGGHTSSYYVGFIIVFVFLFGLLPISFNLSMLVSALIYSIYVVPIVLFDTIDQPRVFVVNSLFLLATMMGGLVWRLVNYRLHISKLSLEFDLSQEKERLQQYSTQLKVLVAERTRELAVSEQKYRGLFDNASDGVAVYDSSGIIVNVNRKFCELHGFPVEALIGTSIKVLDAGKDDAEKEDRFWRILKGESIIYEAKHYRKDGGTILLEISAKCLQIEGNIYVQAFHRDISDKKRLQEQLFQSQKMESIGMLAGGLAHDFNNIVSAIIGHVDMMNEDDSLNADAKRHLAIVEASSRRASQMISKLLKFARKGTVDIQPVALNSVVRDTTELIGKTLSHRNVEVSLELDDAIPPLLGDANQMEQVVMNLMVNAADAMPSGGTIRVATTVRSFGQEAAVVHPLLAPGSYVILRVTDSGTGIPDDVRDKIFDPFFTTKAQGKGTGLGLAMVYGIVKEHKGAVTLSTQVGRGTTFEVYIPAAPVIPAAQPAQPGPKSTTGTVMIVDDEEETLRFVSETVESFGYQIIAVGNAIQALQIFREKSEEIELVITDIFMPVIDGRDMIRNVKSIKPSVKVLAMSGYQIEEFVRNDIPVDDFLGKPFGGIELMSKVNKLMLPKKSLFS